MTTTLDMNTLEHPRKDTNLNDDEQEYINNLQAQLTQSQNGRRQERDYGRILRAYNTPAQWYKASPVTRSIYFYDPQYQRYLQQQSKLLTSNRPILPSVRMCSRTPSQTKHTVNLHNPPNNYQQKQMRPSRLQFVPTLPPIIDYKKAKAE